MKSIVFSKEFVCNIIFILFILVTIYNKQLKNVAFLGTTKYSSLRLKACYNLVEVQNSQQQQTKMLYVIIDINIL